MIDVWITILLAAGYLLVAAIFCAIGYFAGVDRTKRKMLDNVAGNVLVFNDEDSPGHPLLYLELKDQATLREDIAVFKIEKGPQK